MRILSILKYLFILSAISLVSCDDRGYKSCHNYLKKMGFDVVHQQEKSIYSAKLLITELHGKDAAGEYCYGVGNFADRRCYRARPLNGDTSREYAACHFIDK